MAGEPSKSQILSGLPPGSVPHKDNPLLSLLLWTWTLTGVSPVPGSSEICYFLLSPTARKMHVYFSLPSFLPSQICVECLLCARHCPWLDVHP